jgi:anaerobic selenocysteine-containing dehydrogenase
VHNPNRITTPLVRNGPKGSGSFRPASWEEALDLVENNLRRAIKTHGPESILPYSYAGHFGVVHRNAGHAFFHKLGASRLLRTICSSAATAGFKVSLGSGPNTDIESSEHSDLIIIWGANILTTNLHAWPFFKKARKNGARIIVIDPYKNRTARKADLFVQIRPGTDAALALGIMHILIAHDLLDHKFIKENTLGFSALVQKTREWPPPLVERITGVDEGVLEELALAYGQAKAPFIRAGCGPIRQLKGGMAMRTISLLPALVGAFSRPGAGINRSTSPAFGLNTNPLLRPDLSPKNTRVVNMVQLGQALTSLGSPPVKVFYNYLSNPAAVAPDLNQVRAGLKREDLFTVVHELFMTDTARYADVILPGSTSMEITDIYTSYGHYYLQMARPVIPPVGRSRSTLKVFQELADRFDFKEEIFKLNEDEIIKKLIDTDSPYMADITFSDLSLLKPLRLKVTANPFEKGFKTPSGKVEFLSEDLRQKGLPPLPEGSPSLDLDGRDRYTLQLITPPNHHLLNSSFNEVESLRQMAGPPRALLHPIDAEKRGINNAEQIRVFNDRGFCQVQAKVTTETQPGLVVMEGIFDKDASANLLTSQNITDLGDSCAFHCNLVEVSKLENLF